MVASARPLVHSLQAALDALKRGEMILLYDADGREQETDMVVASQFVTPEHIRTMRRDGGGLICTCIGPDFHQQQKLPYLSDLIQDRPELASLMPDDIQYDASKPSFSLTINHRSVFTGITDNDRSTTINALTSFMDSGRSDFGAEFRAPGHVILLNGHKDSLDARQGHTELSLAMADMASLTASTTICEMMADNGTAMDRDAAAAYAEEHGLIFLTGKEVLDAWKARTYA